MKVLLLLPFLVSMVHSAPPNRLIKDIPGGCREINAASVVHVHEGKGVAIPLFGMRGPTVNMADLLRADPKSSAPMYNLCINYEAKNGPSTFQNFLQHYHMLFSESKTFVKLAQEGPVTYADIDITINGVPICFDLDIRNTVHEGWPGRLRDVKIGPNKGNFVYAIYIGLKCNRLTEFSLPPAKY